MHSALLIILPSNTTFISKYVDEVLRSYIAQKGKYIENEVIKEIAKEYGYEEDSLTLIAEAIEEKRGDGILLGVDEEGIFEVLEKYKEYTPDGWRIGGRWDGQILNKPPIVDSNKSFSISIEQIIQNNMCQVLNIDDSFLRGVFAVILPNEEFICYWDFDWKNTGDELFNKRKTEIKQQYGEYMSILVDVHT